MKAPTLVTTMCVRVTPQDAVPASMHRTGAIGRFWHHMMATIPDRANGFLRNPLPRTPVNKAYVGLASSDCPKVGTTPSCIMPITSQLVQLSTILPSEMRSMVIPVQLSSLFVGSIPINTPLCVPLEVALWLPSLLQRAECRSSRGSRGRPCETQSRRSSLPQCHADPPHRRGGVGTTGAESDIEQATDLARRMITRWGMSDKLGTVELAPRENPYLGGPGGYGGEKSYSEETARIVDSEVLRIMGECHDEARRLLS